MEKSTDLRLVFHETEKRLLNELRTVRRGLRKDHKGLQKSAADLTVGQRIADTVAATMGSWTFIIIQSVILLVWIILNVTAYVQQWDPYPFILLNLALSFQAAYAAPFIMMSQNRQQDIDRKAARMISRSTSRLNSRSSFCITRSISCARRRSESHEGGQRADGTAAQRQAGPRRDHVMAKW